MTKTPTATYTHKISHSPRTPGTDELKHKGKKKRLRGCAATDEKVLVPAYVVVQRSSRFKKSRVRARCSFFLQIGGPYAGKSQRWGALRIEGESGGELGVYFFSTTDQ